MTYGLLTRVEADHDEARLERELAAAVAAGSPTVASYAVRYGRGEYGTFAAGEHDDPITEEVRDRIEPLLAAPPTEQAVQILGSKPLEFRSAPVTKGVLLTFAAKPERAAEVEDFLAEAQPVAEAERGTTAWYALHLADGDYGIFDVFPSSGARLRHLTGPIPRELTRRSLALLGSFPEIHLVDVVAATPGA